MATLDAYLNKLVSVVTQDGRLLVGTLRGFDQTANVILDESHERIFHPDQGVETVVLGLYIIRGDNIAVVGEIDEDMDREIELDEVRAPSLLPVVY